MQSPKIFGTGLIALDLVIGPGAPVRCWAGGTCANVLAILAFFGWETYPVARLSDDAASERIREDMALWGVRLDWAACGPAAHPPIIVQTIRHEQDGRPRHRFSWSCPNCGSGLPRFRPVAAAAAKKIKPALSGTSAFFFDRPSQAALSLAAEASVQGALVVFEPSTRATLPSTAEAMSLAHVVKYAEERGSKIRGLLDKSPPLLEVCTLGERGLRYRHRLCRGISDWIHLKALPAPRLADACGAGDWCTAGLIAKIAADGREGLRRAGARGVRAALRCGQALAAWNCNFEGARGGMYAAPRRSSDSRIDSLFEERFDGIDNQVTAAMRVVPCPACPPRAK